MQLPSVWHFRATMYACLSLVLLVGWRQRCCERLAPSAALAAAAAADRVRRAARGRTDGPRTPAARAREPQAQVWVEARRE